jgi:hypothetical protein
LEVVTREHLITRAVGRGTHADSSPTSGPGTPGKRTLVEALSIAEVVGRAGGDATVQRRAAAGADAVTPDGVQAAAERGTSGTATTLPHFDRIQQLFGRHDVSGVRAYVGGAAAEGARAMGAEAFATGDQVAFRAAPDLHTAAHEAAHVVQQRAGVHLKGGVGEQGDAHERHADAVADAVVRGESSEALLDQYAGGGSSATPVVARKAVQRIVLNLDPGDPVITESALIHKQRDDEQAQELNKAHGKEVSNPNSMLITGDFDPSKTLPLHKIALDESITIVAHGTPAMGRDVPRVAGKTAPELFQHLVKMGLTTKHTGIINLSNCTSAWDRRSTGSFLDLFVKQLQAAGHNNFVTGYESFTESTKTGEELEVPHDKREIFLAHKVTERYMARLMNMRPEDARKNDGAPLQQMFSELLAGAKDAMIESLEFSKKSDDESTKLSKYYDELSQYLMAYLAEAQLEKQFNEKRAGEYNIQLLALMKRYEIDFMGARLDGKKTEAIPVVSGGGQ